MIEEEVHTFGKDGNEIKVTKGRFIGAGTYGEVYVAHSLDKTTKYALKFNLKERID